MAKKKKKSSGAGAGAAGGAAGGAPPSAAPTSANARQPHPATPAAAAGAAPTTTPTTSRRYTLSLAVPASLVEDAPSAEAATLAAAAVARAAALHRVDELVVVDDTPQRKDGTIGAAAALVARVVQALETPPYLRPHLLPLAHPDLAALNACPPIELPHHLRPTEWCAFREGVVMTDTTNTSSESPRTFVDVGLDRMALVKGVAAPPGARVTVRLGPAPQAEYVSSHGESMLLGELVDSDAPKRELFEGGRATGAWGFSVRLAKGMHGLLRECPFASGGGEDGAENGGNNQEQQGPTGLEAAEDGDLAAAARRMMEERKRQKRLEREQKQQQAAQQAASAKKAAADNNNNGYDLVIGLSVDEGQAVRRAEDLALPRGFKHALVVVAAPGAAASAGGAGGGGGLRGSLARDKRLRGKDLSELFALLLSPLPASAVFSGGGGGGGSAGGKSAQPGAVPSAALGRACRGLRCEDAALLGLALLSPALEAFGLGGGGGEDAEEGMMMESD
jgi:predicted SPOUT superfamily RNA methylase MTH1